MPATSDRMKLSRDEQNILNPSNSMFLLRVSHEWTSLKSVPVTQLLQVIHVLPWLREGGKRLTTDLGPAVPEGKQVTGEAVTGRCAIQGLGHKETG